ncbi:MAG: hypothetical protein RLZZ370_1501 [Bacteroidota bacterium]|jgi:hypothetical protein
MEKGALLLKGESGLVTRLYPFIAVAVILWIFSAICYNLAAPEFHWIIDALVLVTAAATMFLGTKNWVHTYVYEHGIELLHPFTRRREFRSFASINHLETKRINISTRYNRANYVDALDIFFEDGTRWELSSMELDNFYEFRSLCMNQYQAREQKWILE